MKHLNGSASKKHDIIRPVRRLLEKTGKPFAMENVVMESVRRELSGVADPLATTTSSVCRECGSSFGVMTRRHRLQGISGKSFDFPCDHAKECLGAHSRTEPEPPAPGMRGKEDVFCCPGSIYQVVGSALPGRGTVKEFQDVMEAPRRTRKGLVEAQHPRYAEAMIVFTAVQLWKDRWSEEEFEKHHGEKWAYFEKATKDGTWFRGGTPWEEHIEVSNEELAEEYNQLLQAIEEIESEPEGQEENNQPLAVVPSQTCHGPRKERVATSEAAAKLAREIAQVSASLAEAAAGLARQLEEWETLESPWGKRLEEYQEQVVYMPEDAQWITRTPLYAEERFSPEERARRDQIEKYKPLEYNYSRWVELGILTPEEAEEYRMGIPLNFLGNRTEQIGPESYATLPENADPQALADEWTRMLWREAITTVPREALAKISPALAVVTQKLDKIKTRMCIDPTKNVNPYCVIAKFWMPLVHAFAASLQRGWWMYGDDLIDAFLTVKVIATDTALLGLSHPLEEKDQAMIRVWLFGLSGSPEVYDRLSSKIDDFWWRVVKPKAYMRFCDDSTGAAKDYTTALNEQGLFEVLNVQLGRIWSRVKRELPVQDRKTLGKGIRTEHESMTGEREVQLYVTEERRELTQQEIVKLKEKALARLPIHPKELCRVVGLLNFIAGEVIGGNSHLRHLMGAFRGFTVDWRHGTLIGSGHTQPLKISPEMIGEMDWWVETLKTDTGVRSLTSKLDMLVTVIGADASTSHGGGGVVYVSAAPEEHAQVWSDMVKSKVSINALELREQIDVIEDLGERVRDRTILTINDNTQAVAAITKRRVNSDDMMADIFRLEALEKRLNMSVFAIHQPGVRMVREDGISREIPVQKHIGRVGEAKVTAWEKAMRGFNASYGRGESHVQHLELAGMTSYLFPAFSQINTVLHLIDRAIAEAPMTTRGIIVLPEERRANPSSLKGLRILQHFPPETLPVEKWVRRKWSKQLSERGWLLCVYPAGTPVSLPRPAQEAGEWAPEQFLVSTGNKSFLLIKF